MMDTSRETESKIIAPAVQFPIDGNQTDPKHNLTKELVHESFGCHEGDSKCEFQKGDPKCKYSRTDFLEVMMPMFRPEALWKILTECNKCIHEGSLWGLNNVWCKFVVDKFRMGDDMNGCALLDQHR